MPSTTIPHIKDTKDPRATLDYGFDWTDWLGADSISTSVWTFEPGLTKALATVSGAVTAIWFSGGVDGQSYKVTNYITTLNSPHRVEYRSFYIDCVLQ